MHYSFPLSLPCYVPQFAVCKFCFRGLPFGLVKYCFKLAIVHRSKKEEFILSPRLTLASFAAWQLQLSERRALSHEHHEHPCSQLQRRQASRRAQTEFTNKCSRDATAEQTTPCFRKESGACGTHVQPPPKTPFGGRRAMLTTRSNISYTFASGMRSWFAYLIKLASTILDRLDGELMTLLC